MTTKVIGVNDRGNPVGQYHRLAKLSDAEVDLIRDLYEEDLIGLGSLAKTFGVSKETIADIVKYRRRVSTIMDWRRVEDKAARRKAKREKDKVRRRKANKAARAARKVTRKK